MRVPINTNACASSFRSHAERQARRSLPVRDAVQSALHDAAKYARDYFPHLIAEVRLDAAENDAVIHLQRPQEVFRPPLAIFH